MSGKPITTGTATQRAILQAALDLANAQSAALRSALQECRTEPGANAFYNQAAGIRRLVAINEIVRLTLEGTK